MASQDKEPSALVVLSIRWAVVVYVAVTIAFAVWTFLSIYEKPW